MVVAGTMLLTMAGLLGTQLFNLAMTSTEGANAMAQLQQNMTNAQNAIGNAVYEVLQASGILNLLNSILTLIADNPWAAKLIVILAVVVIGAIALLGALLLLNGVFMQLATATRIWTMLFGPLEGMTLAEADAAMQLRAAVSQLVQVAMPLVAALMVFSLLQSWLGPLPAALFAVAAALAVVAIQAVVAGEGMSALTGGWAGAAAFAGILAGSIGMAAAATHFQMGTRALPYTGAFFGHAGEVVYNPRTGRPAGVEGEMGGGIEMHEWHMPITIENVHTKADFDDVDDQFRTTFRRNLRTRR
jgi:hypothetical protein